MAAVHWSSELSKWEFRELQATSMAIDWSGNHVLLAGKRCLAIKNLNLESEANETVKKIPRQSKYDVAGAEWCQTSQGQRFCAISSNQRVDIYHWRNGELTGIHTLRGHTRVVSDTHWHREDHNLFATCSIDTFTYLWDLRDSRKPVLSLSAVAGASQVQWNKVSSHLLATAHDGDVKLWDKRKGCSPIQYISAHLSKIHGLDWSPHHEYQLVTSSHDGTIKYFDINNPRRVETTITTNYPVWRAIYTPFGSGLVTMGVGWGGVTRGDQAGVVGMWVNSVLAHRLIGHSDVVLQMQWRPNVTPSNYQLITWARDQTLRMWSMHPSLLKMCSHYLPDDTDIEDDALSETMSYMSTGEMNESNSVENNDIKMVKLPPQEPQQLLSDELERIKDLESTLENLTVQDVDLDHKTCQVKIELNSHIAILRISFTNTYPSDQMIPKFSWLSGTNLDSNSTIKILQAINFAAYQKARQQSPCVEFCLKTLCNYLKQIPMKLKEDGSSNKLNEAILNSEGSESNTNSDHCIPFPRTCGVRWCGVGMLVVFNRPPNAKRMSLKSESTTPRSLSSLSTPMLINSNFRSHSPNLTTSPSPTNHFLNHLNNHRSSTYSITALYFHDRWKTPSRRIASLCHISPKITLYSVDELFQINKSLAEKYIINNDSVSSMCEHNARVAESFGRLDLMQAWQLSALTAENLEQQKNSYDQSCLPFPPDKDNSINWSLHPFGSNMLQSLINHYAKISDIQMAAMLCCAFSAYYGTYLTRSKSSDLSTNSNGSGSSPYVEMSLVGWSSDSIIKPGRPSSWSDSTDFNPSYHEYSSQCVEKNPENVSTPILDSFTINLYQCYMKVYADILHRWNLLDARTEVMKHVTNNEEIKHSGIELVCECQICKKIIKGSFCAMCSTVVLNCVVCSIGVRGSANACMICGHGGHTKHLEEWFNKFDVCPSGCGCRCLHESGNFLELSTKSNRGVLFSRVGKHARLIQNIMQDFE